MDLTEDVDQIHMAPDRISHEGNTEDLGSVRGTQFLGTLRSISLPRRPLFHSASYTKASICELKNLHPQLTEN
jgi:hypothetical protein